MAKKSQEKSPLYKREGSPFYYYDTKNPVTGKRTRRSTHEADPVKALEVYREAMAITSPYYAARSTPLSDILKLYTDIDTNPRRKQAQIDGTSYGLQHAKKVAGHARILIDLLKKEAPLLLNRAIGDYTRIDIKMIKQIIVEEKGNCRQAQSIFQSFKTFFAQAFDDGIIPFSPAQAVRNVRYQEQARISIEPEKIAKLIAARAYFPDTESWAYFTILATTGMRRSEVLALNSEQLHKGTLTIDRALKDTDQNAIGLPKWDLVRVIPLSAITLDAIRAITPHEDGRYFKHGRAWADTVFKRIQAVANVLFPEDRNLWCKLTPHILRHSMNTNLLCAGEPILLVAEYLSWSHQQLLDMQQRYTHIYASSMQRIANCIDDIYSIKSYRLQSPGATMADIKLYFLPLPANTGCNGKIIK